MKKLNRILFGAVIATTLSLAAQAKAQFKVNEADGIAASPKVRQMLNERKASADAAALASKMQPAPAMAPAGYRVVSADGIAASPKIRQMLDQQNKVPAPAQPSTIVAGYQPVGKDGITASPKVRQQLDERGAGLMIAPVK